MSITVIPIFLLLVASLNQVAGSGWIFTDPITIVDTNKTFASTLACDDELIVSGQFGWSGTARVYDIASLNLKYVLEANRLQNTPAPFSHDNIQVGLGDNIIATVSSNDGTVSIWDRNDRYLLYQAKHHGRGVQVSGVAVTEDDCVITAGDDGSLIFVEDVDGDSYNWKISETSYENKDEITHLAVDGKWAVTGHMKKMKLWDLEERKLVEMYKDSTLRRVGSFLGVAESKNPVTVAPVWMVTLNYPYAFAVGGSYWKGVQVWDMENGLKIRHILQEEKGYQYIHSSRDLLTFGEFVNSWMTGRDDDRMLKLGVYDIQELTDEAIEEENLWSKTFQYSGNSSNKKFRAATNKDTLIVDHGRNKIDLIKYKREN